MDNLRLSHNLFTPCVVSFHAQFDAREIWVTALDSDGGTNVTVERVVGGQREVYFSDMANESGHLIQVNNKTFEILDGVDPYWLPEARLLSQTDHTTLQFVQSNSSVGGHHNADFGEAIKAMLKDPVTVLIVDSSFSLTALNVTARSYSCIQPFHTLAMKLSREGITDRHSQKSGLPWDPRHPKRPYQDCNNPQFGRCGWGDMCWEQASGCDCGCNRWCEHHDHFCSCFGMLHPGCWTMAKGGWKCEPCVGPTDRTRDRSGHHPTFNVTEMSFWGSADDSGLNVSLWNDSAWNASAWNASAWNFSDGTNLSDWILGFSNLSLHNLSIGVSQLHTAMDISVWESRNASEFDASDHP